jgi:hypothetical protein
VAKNALTSVSKRLRRTIWISRNARAGTKLRFRRRILRKVASCQEHTVHIVGLYYIRDDAAVQNDPLNACSQGQIDHPVDGVHLSSTYLRCAPEAGLHLVQRSSVNARW